MTIDQPAPGPSSEAAQGPFDLPPTVGLILAGGLARRMGVREKKQEGKKDRENSRYDSLVGFHAGERSSADFVSSIAHVSGSFNPKYTIRSGQLPAGR